MAGNPFPVWRWMLPLLVGLAVAGWLWSVFRVDTGWEGVPLALLGGVAAGSLFAVTLSWLFGRSAPRPQPPTG